MELLTREAILNAVDLPTREENVPEWGGPILLRGLTGKGRDEYEIMLAQVRKNEKINPAEIDIRASMVEKCIVDKNGNRVFADGELRNKSAAVLDRLFDICQELSGMGPGAVAEAGKG